MANKQSIKNSTIFFSCLALLGSCKKEKKSLIHEKNPNIIVIITDDQGYGDLGFHGNPVIKTPVLDSLARASVRFNRFYVSPVCAPTRSSLMSGKYSIKTGMYDTYNGGALMEPSQTTIAEALSDHGYRTGIFGKWHLGDDYPRRPVDQGFSESLVHGGGGIGQPGDHIYNFLRKDSSYFDPVLFHNGEPEKFRGYCSDIFTDAAIQFISDKTDAPFFIYLSYNAPHTPLQVPGEYYEIYKDVDISPDLFPHPDLMPEMTEKDKEDARKVYAMVTNIDDNLRRLFSKIDEKGIRDNTLVIFLTDNGPQQARYNGGLRNRKGSTAEGGIKVPCFWYWPGNFEGGREINQFAAHMDIFPTLMDICGIQKPDDLDGRSLLPVLNNEESEKKDQDKVLISHWIRGYPEPYRNIAVTTDRFKLLANADWMADTSGFMLFDLHDDPFEQVNLRDSLPHLKDSLQEIFDNWYLENVVENEFLVGQYISVGSDQQPEVVLTRQDCFGRAGKIWTELDSYGYWKINVEKEGLYDVSLLFENNPEITGNIILRSGNIQRSLENDNLETNSFVMKNIALGTGEQVFEVFYEGGNWHDRRLLVPLYVTIKKLEDQ